VLSCSEPKALKPYQIACFIGFGFSSGLPFLMVLSTLGVRLIEAGIRPFELSLFSLATLPYTLKFFLSPFIDLWSVPYLSKKLGRRRSWALLFQALLCLSLIALGYEHATFPILWMGTWAFLVSFFATLQDIVLETLRIEHTPPKARGTSAWAVSLGFRLGLLVSGGGALFIADRLSWFAVYTLIALGIVIGMISVLCTKEESYTAIQCDRPLLLRLNESLRELFSRHSPLFILTLLLMAKMTETILNIMSTPFILSMGHTKIEFATFSKVYGLAALLLGSFGSGLFLNKKTLDKAFIWAFIMQFITAFLFFTHTFIGYSKPFLAFSMMIQNFSSGFLGTVIIAMISALAKQPYTATQYGVIASISSLSRLVWSCLSGSLTMRLPWQPFFFVLLMAQACVTVVLILFIPKITRIWKAEKSPSPS